MISYLTPCATLRNPPKIPNFELDIIPIINKKIVEKPERLIKKNKPQEKLFKE